MCNQHYFDHQPKTWQHMGCYEKSVCNRISAKAARKFTVIFYLQKQLPVTCKDMAAQKKI